MRRFLRRLHGVSVAAQPALRRAHSNCSPISTGRLLPKNRPIGMSLSCVIPWS